MGTQMQSPEMKWEHDAQRFYDETGYTRLGNDQIAVLGGHSRSTRFAAWAVWKKMDQERYKLMAQLADAKRDLAHWERFGKAREHNVMIK